MCKNNEKYEQVLNDLRDIYGDQKVLFPEDLGDLLGHQIVKSLKANLGIPLPVLKVGKRVGVSIYDTAEWIANGKNGIRPAAKKAVRDGLAPPAKARLVPARELFALETQINFLEQIRLELLLQYSSEPNSQKILAMNYGRIISTTPTSKRDHLLQKNRTINIQNLAKKMIKNKKS
jgi:hypothetical protein